MKQCVQGMIVLERGIFKKVSKLVLCNGMLNNHDLEVECVSVVIILLHFIEEGTYLKLVTIFNSKIAQISWRDFCTLSVLFLFFENHCANNASGYCICIDWLYALCIYVICIDEG